MSNNINKKRIVVNKYTNNPSEIIEDAFYSGYGELILSIKNGEESIFTKNENGEIVKLSINKDLVEKLVLEKINELGKSSFQDLTKSQYDELIEKNEIIVDGKTIIYNENTYYMIIEE